MKAKFPIAATVLVLAVAPVFASAPSSNEFSASPNDQMAQPAPGQYMGDTYGDAVTQPFGDRLQQNQMDEMRPMTGRDHNLQPPRMDASGVPDPRI